jgi:hypothetical protein
MAWTAELGVPSHCDVSSMGRPHSLVEHIQGWYAASGLMGLTVVSGVLKETPWKDNKLCAAMGIALIHIVDDVISPVARARTLEYMSIVVKQKPL